MLWNFGQLPLQYLVIEALHVFGLEWRFQCDHLVNDATKTPYIAFDIVRLILPNFGTCVVGCPSLGVV